MTDSDPNSGFPLSRRQMLSAASVTSVLGFLGGSGSLAYFNDKETSSGNTLTAGRLNLTLHWTVKYRDSRTNTQMVLSQGGPSSGGKPIVEIEDIKPGDILTHSFRLKVDDNPGFISVTGASTANVDNGIVEPEDEVDSSPSDASDGTSSGDLARHLRCVAWIDDESDGFPDEITDFTVDERGEFYRELTASSSPFDLIDVTSDAYQFSGTFQKLLSQEDSIDGVPLSPQSTESAANCFEPGREYNVGLLCWLPRDIPGVNDNIVQSDKLVYNLGFQAVQCRHNTRQDQSTLDRMHQTHTNYLNNTPTAPDRTTFTYEPVDLSRQIDGNLSFFKAVPSEAPDGDRIIIKPAQPAVPLEDIVRVLVASWGATPDQPLHTTTVYGTETTFIGGTGANVAVAGATTQVPNLGKAILLARATDVSELEPLISSFDTIYP